MRQRQGEPYLFFGGRIEDNAVDGRPPIGGVVGQEDQPVTRAGVRASVEADRVLDGERGADGVEVEALVKAVEASGTRELRVCAEASVAASEVW